MPAQIFDELNKLNGVFKRNAVWFVPVSIVCYALLITGLWLPFHWGKYGFMDHSLTYTSYEAIRLLIFKYGQFPLYLQNLNGGIDLWADPQSMTLGVFNIFPLLFGAIIGHKLSVLCAYMLGMAFTYRLSKQIFPNQLIALLLGLTYGSLGYFSHHIIEAGHSNFIYFHLLPLLGHTLYSQFTKEVSWKTSLVIVSIYTQMILGGALPMIMITLCCLIPILLSTTWPNYKFTLFQAGLGIGSIALLGIKIYPFLDVFGGRPRVFHDTAGMNLQELLLAFVDSKPYSASQSITYHGWWEHGIGIGLIVPLIAMYFLPKFKNWKLIFFTLAIITWLGMGNSPNYANPWYIANTYLPIFENFRAPYRFLIGTALALIFIIPFGLKKAKTGVKYIAVILLISLGYNTANVLAISKSFTTSQNTADIEQSYVESNLAKQSSLISINTEIEPYQYLLLREDKHLVNTHYPLLDQITHKENSPLVSGAVIVENSQSIVKLKANRPRIQTALNYSPYWTCSAGEISEENGKLAIQTTIGTLVTLEYKPRYWKKGSIVSIVGLILLLGLITWGYKSKFTEDVLSD
ncbi:hypothetical protein N9772_05910 [Bacteroidia bacterium]|nr:hypothetical protein [Bacteroidia bacterium]